MARVARVSFLAAGSHVLTSMFLAGVIALVGLQFQHQIEGQQGHIVGGVLALTGIGFLLWALAAAGRPTTTHGLHSASRRPDRHQVS